MAVAAASRSAGRATTEPPDPGDVATTPVMRTTSMSSAWRGCRGAESQRVRQLASTSSAQAGNVTSGDCRRGAASQVAESDHAVGDRAVGGPAAQGLVIHGRGLAVVRSPSDHGVDGEAGQAVHGRDGATVDRRRHVPGVDEHGAPVGLDDPVLPPGGDAHPADLGIERDGGDESRIEGPTHQGARGLDHGDGDGARAGQADRARHGRRPLDVHAGQASIEVVIECRERGDRDAVRCIRSAGDHVGDERARRCPLGNPGRAVAQSDDTGCRRRDRLRPPRLDDRGEHRTAEPVRRVADEPDARRHPHAPWRRPHHSRSDSTVTYFVGSPASARSPCGAHTHNAQSRGASSTSSVDVRIRSRRRQS